MGWGRKLSLATEVLIAYGRLYVLMRRRELSDVVAGLRAPCGGGSPLPWVERRRLSAVVMRILELLPTDSRCLIRSLVLMSLLEHRDTPCELVIGVQAEPVFAAHAWVECDGEALLPTGDGRYAPLTVL